MTSEPDKVVSAVRLRYGRSRRFLDAILQELGEDLFVLYAIGVAARHMAGFHESRQLRRAMYSVRSQSDAQVNQPCLSGNEDIATFLKAIWPSFPRYKWMMMVSPSRGALPLSLSNPLVDQWDQSRVAPTISGEPLLAKSSQKQ